MKRNHLNEKCPDWTNKKNPGGKCPGVPGTYKGCWACGFYNKKDKLPILTIHPGKKHDGYLVFGDKTTSFVKT